MPADSAEKQRRQDYVTELTADPRRGKSVAARWARKLPPGEAVAFFEQACRTLATAGDTDSAGLCFTQLLALDPATDEAGLGRRHARFLQFAPLGAIAPKDYRDYAKTLTAALDPAAAHARFREVICAGLDAGRVPYAAIFPDLRGLARAAGIKRADEEQFLADRLLRGGALAVASLRVWQGALPALARVAEGGDDATLRLLVESEPADGADDPQVAEQVRLLWLELLVRARAGRVLSPEWFAGPGAKCPMDVLFALVDQAELPGWQPATASDGGDAADAADGVDDDSQFTAGDPERNRYSRPRWVNDPEAMAAFAELVREGADDRAQRAAHAEQLSGHVLRLGSYLNEDPVTQLKDLWNAGAAVRDLLNEQVDGWLADAASAGLHAQDAALLRLLRLAEAGYQDLDPRLAAIAITDPAVALMTSLRTGLAAELALPGPLGDAENWESRVRVALDGTRLTVSDKWAAHIMEPRQQVRHVPVPELLDDAKLAIWHDGVSVRLARRANGRRHSFRFDTTGRDPLLTLDADPSWPSPLTDGEVVFPGASAATRVSCGEGFLHVHAPDGSAASRLPFGGLQKLGRQALIVAPPAWWQYLEPADLLGSAALRAIDEARARRLIAAGYQGPQTVDRVLSEVLPDVTHPRLRAAVAEAAAVARRCETNAAWLRRRLGLAQPASLPDLLRSRPGLPFHGTSLAVAGARLLAAQLRDAFAEQPAPDGVLRLLNTVELPVDATRFWFHGNLLGGFALHAARPWLTTALRDTMLETLRALANTPQADGSRQWRYRTLKRDTNWSTSLTGQLWRTPTSVLAVLSNDPLNTVFAVEYAPDGLFDPRVPDDWTGQAALTERVRMPGWGTPDRVASFIRLLEENGPIPLDPGLAHQLAERAEIGVPDAAFVCFGGPSTPGQPKAIEALYEGRKLDQSDIEDIRERLMPDEPADLWGSGLAIDRAAEWWLSPR